MSLAKLYQIRTGGELSSEDCQRIHDSLAQMGMADIPIEQIVNVTDYLASALNMNSIKKEHIEDLERLLRELQYGA
jgi:hypothetical protein